jgi:hypothetical protein
VGGQLGNPEPVAFIGDLKGPLVESLLHDAEELHKKYGENS